MEKIIIEVNSSFIPEELFKYEDPVFLIGESCFLSDSQRRALKYVNLPVKELEKGPLYIRTNSELFKGICIGMISGMYKKTVLIRDNARIEVNFKSLFGSKLQINPTRETSECYSETVQCSTNPKRNPFEKIKIVKKPYTDSEVFDTNPYFYQPCNYFNITAQAKRNFNSKTTSRHLDKSPKRLQQRAEKTQKKPSVFINSQKKDEVVNSKPEILKNLQNNSELVVLKPVEFVFNPKSESFERLN